MAFTTQDPMPTLYGPDGRAIVGRRQAVPELDPTFLMSFSQLLAGSSGSMLRKALDAPYQFYVWVYACAGVISTNLCRLKPALYEIADENKMVRAHEILRLFSRPNPFMSGSQLMEAICLNLLLPTRRTSGGQCFLVANDEAGKPKTSFRRGQIPKEIYPFSDEYITPVVVHGQFSHWELRLPNAPILKLDRDEVIRINLYNPYDLLRGMSPYSAALYGVESDLKSSELARKFSDNSANIGGVLTTDKQLSPEAAADLRVEWEQRYGGPDKSGRTAILHSGLTFEQTARSLVDLQFIEGKRMNREEILAAYRVSPMVLGITNEQGLNYATANAAMKGFWELTLLPLLDRIWEGLNSQWFNNVEGGKYNGYSDLSQVEALRKDYKDKVAIADTMIKHGVTTAEAYRTLDIPADTKKQPWLEQPLVIGSRVNLATGDVIGQPTFGLSEPTPTTEPARHLRFIQRENDVIMKEDARERWWTGWVKRTLVAGEKRMQTVVTKYFINQRNATLDLVDEWARRQSRALRTGADDFSLSLSDWNLALKKLALPIYDAGISVQAAQVADELGELVNWAQNAPYVEEYKQQRLDFLQEINTSTFALARDKIGMAIEQAVANNLSVVETANLIKDSIQQTYGVRLGNAPTIARTEMSSIASTTRFSIFGKEGIEEHEWLSARDERVREEHMMEDGNHVHIGERFPVTGLTYPGEIGGPPGKVINCRCAAIVHKT